MGNPKRETPAYEKKQLINKVCRAAKREQEKTAALKNARAELRETRDPLEKAEQELQKVRMKRRLPPWAAKKVRRTFPILSEDETGTANRPFTPVDAEAGGPMEEVVHFVDIASDHRQNIDRDAILEHFRRKTFKLFVAPTDNGGKYIIKHYVVKNKINIHSPPSMRAGQAREIARGIHEKSGTKALQHLPMHFPGLKIRRWARRVGGERVAMQRSATKFDFLRGQPGKKSCARVCDDGALNEQRARAVKSFADVGDDESMIWARWGATECAQGQPRLIVDNAFNPAALRPTSGGFPTISRKDFPGAVSTTFPPGATLADLLACLQRSRVALNFARANGNVYVLNRLASEGTEPVRCFVLGESNFINMRGRRRTDLWNEGRRQFGTDCDQGVLRGQNWLAQLMDDGEIPRGHDADSGAEDVSAAAEPQPFGKLCAGNIWGSAAAAPGGGMPAAPMPAPAAPGGGLPAAPMPAPAAERHARGPEAGAISLTELSCLKKGAVNDGFDALRRLAPAKKEGRSVEQLRALRAPIKRGPEGPRRAAGSTEKAAEQKVFSATPVGKEWPSTVAPPLLSEDVRASPPKKGKLRMVPGRPSAAKTKDWKNAPCAREKSATPGRGLRREQAKCKRAVPKLSAASDVEIAHALLGDKLLVDWAGAACPFSGRGELVELAARPREGDRFLRRSNAKGCQKHAPPARHNPIFSQHSASESSQKQAVAPLAKLAGVSTRTPHVLFDVNHKAVEQTWSNVGQVRRMRVEGVEPTIEYNGPKVWADVEADEATFDKLDLADGPEPLEDPSHLVMRDQWLGNVQRGRQRALTLTRLGPEMAEKRSPGPGAVRKVKWNPRAERWLQDRDGIFHTDSARSYKLSVPGVIHDFVVHKKKYKIVGGKRVLIPPGYVELKTPALPSGKHFKVKSGVTFQQRPHAQERQRQGRNQTACHQSPLGPIRILAQDDLWVKTREMVMVQHIMRDLLTA
ncbi:unnamed protein product [Prorocentrum cordatum]|uniref:Uncharacterized protein n=1 Tax=Prorocentrum cordatum TaxID=2364126 RepID=A0ABN9USC3_9DINO|nr:unnamed protein product [Polarella glacialis]